MEELAMDQSIGTVSAQDSGKSDDQGLQSILPVPVVVLGNRVDTDSICFAPKFDAADMETVFSGSTLRCSECRKEFSSSTALLEHLHSHTQDSFSDIDDSSLNIVEDGHDIDCTNTDTAACSSQEARSVAMSSAVKHNNTIPDEENFHICITSRTDVEALSIEPINKNDVQRFAEQHSSGKIYGEMCVPDTVSNENDILMPEKIANENFMKFINSCMEKSDVSVQMNSTDQKDADVSSVKKKPLRNVLKSPIVYQCEACDKTYEKKSALERHFKAVHFESCRCSHCGEEFSLRSSLHKHMKQQHEEESRNCEHCNEKFDVRAEFQRHKKTHTNRPPVRCGQCSAVFVFKKDLKTHTKEVHREMRLTDEQPVIIADMITNADGKSASIFRCNLCTRAFNLKTDLIRHFLVHSGEKPFACDMCDSRFNRRSNLLRHRRSMHNIIDYTEKCRYRKSDLRQRKYQNRELWEIESESLAEEERIIREQELLEKQRQIKIQEWINEQTDNEFLLVDEDDQDYKEVPALLIDDTVPTSGVELDMLKPDEKITVRILTFDS